MMNKVRPYFPLLGFVLPTLFIGYGFVIPRSCIAGVNALSVGFASTVAGAVVAYFAGVRLAGLPTQAAVCTKPPLRVRLWRWINRQAAHPKGLFGRFLGWNWKHETASVNATTLDLLGIEPTNHVLEVGCGPGLALQEAARRANGGRVLGVDVSPLMVQGARRHNRVAIREARVEVQQADADTLSLEAGTFDRIYSVHCLYFWKNLDRVLGQLAGALRPGGRLVLAFRPEGSNIPARFRDATYRFYAADEITARLSKLGLASQLSKESDTVAWISAERP
jgi:SAM-dependent methyltransferase